MDELLHISFIHDNREIPSELDEDEDTDISDATNEDLRVRYWTKALPVLTAAFGGNSTYSNVSPSSRSTIDGFVGISGINIFCSMRMTKQTLSANIWIDVKDKEKNKKIFDAMYSRKEAIESIVASPIKWNRRDDKRSSTINVELHNVTFSDTSLWDNQIAFLANTCVALKNELITSCEQEIRAIIDR